MAATRARPPPRRLRTPSSPGRCAQLAANRVAAAQYRGAANTITAPPGPAARAARERGAPEGPWHSRRGTPLGHLAAPRVQPSRPPLLGHTHPLPRPGPLRPECSRFPASPSSALAQEAPPRPLPRNPPAPRPPNRSSTAGGSGGRRGAAAGGPERARSRGSGLDSVPG